VQIELAEPMAELSSFFRCRDDHLIDTGRVLSPVHLGDATNAFEHIRLTPQHQSLQRSHSFQIAFS
jgi:hypothetical protein